MDKLVCLLLFFRLVDQYHHGSAGVDPSREQGHPVSGSSQAPLSVTSREWESRKLKVITALMCCDDSAYHRMKMMLCCICERFPGGFDAIRLKTKSAMH